ncbi:MAG: TraB/GumN family protein [Acidobacteria bacterium]|nr:TraB/GumN family protein [Acidobacteriota bacterium]
MVATSWFALVAPPASYAAAPGTSAPATSGRAPLLWEVKTTPPVYLFGTIHLPDPAVVTLAPPVEAAFTSANAVYLELLLDADTQMKAGMGSMLPQGQTLKALLPETVATRLDTHLQARGLNIGMFAPFHIWAITAQLPLLDHLVELAKGGALDSILYKRAIEAGKRVAALETVDEQLAALGDFTRDEQVALLEATLDEMDKVAPGKKASDEILAAYLTGDLGALESLMGQSVDLESALGKKYKAALLDTRNRRMSARLLPLLKDSARQETVFVAVGALHLVGETGLVNALEKAGFTLSRVGATEPALEPAGVR